MNNYNWLITEEDKDEDAEEEKRKRKKKNDKSKHLQYKCERHSVIISCVPQVWVLDQLQVNESHPKS